MNEIKQLNRIAKRYENWLESGFSYSCDNISFHIEQLELAIATSRSSLEVTEEEISDWADAIQELSNVDDANNWLKKIELKIMTWYVNDKYDKALKYLYNLNSAMERVSKIVFRLKQISFFCR